MCIYNVYMYICIYMYIYIYYTTYYMVYTTYFIPDEVADRFSRSTVLYIVTSIVYVIIINIMLHYDCYYYHYCYHYYSLYYYYYVLRQGGSVFFFVQCGTDPQTARSARKLACQGQPHIILAPVRPRMQAASLQCLKAPGCGCLSRPANPRFSRYGAFPKDPVTQVSFSGRCRSPWEKATSRVRVADVTDRFSRSGACPVYSQLPPSDPVSPDPSGSCRFRVCPSKKRKTA